MHTGERAACRSTFPMEITLVVSLSWLLTVISESISKNQRQCFATKLHTVMDGQRIILTAKADGNGWRGKTMLQRTPEWFAERLGKVTASRIDCVMATIKTGEA